MSGAITKALNAHCASSYPLIKIPNGVEGILSSLRHLGTVSKFNHCALANLCHNVEEIRRLSCVPIEFPIAKHCTILQKGLTAYMGDGRILLKISAPFKNKTTNELTSLSARSISNDSIFKKRT
jgi:hypothetical protein